jgi:hypothetical protein
MRESHESEECGWAGNFHSDSTAWPSRRGWAQHAQALVLESSSISASVVHLPRAAGNTQHGVRSTDPEETAGSIPFLPLLGSPYSLGLREGRRQHFFTHGWPLDPRMQLMCSFRTVGSQPQIHCSVVAWHAMAWARHFMKVVFIFRLT